MPTYTEKGKGNSEESFA